MSASTPMRESTIKRAAVIHVAGITPSSAAMVRYRAEKTSPIPTRPTTMAMVRPAMARTRGVQLRLVIGTIAALRAAHQHADEKAHPGCNGDAGDRAFLDLMAHALQTLAAGVPGGVHQAARGVAKGFGGGGHAAAHFRARCAGKVDGVFLQAPGVGGDVAAFLKGIASGHRLLLHCGTRLRLCRC